MQRPKIINETGLVFCFCLAVLAGPALSTLFDHQVQHFPDAASYLGLASGDFDQTTVRRYRILIPLAAAALDRLAGAAFESLRPSYFTADFSLAFAFFLVNMVLMAATGTLVYKFCRGFHSSRPAAIAGVLTVLTARYAIAFAALPLIDSLVLLASAMVLLGIKTGNRKLLVLAIFIGPWARESFIFLAPLILIYAKIPIMRQLAYFVASGVLVFSFRYAMDAIYPPTTTHWLTADLQHLNNVGAYAPLLFSFYGLYKLLVNMGLWLFLPLLAFALRGNFLRGKFGTFSGCAILYLISILVQVLLSGSIERLCFPGMILFAVVAALATDVLTDRYHAAGAA